MRFNRGFVLLAVTMALAVLAVLTYAMTHASGLTARTTTRLGDAERARLLAEAGLAHALRDMQEPTASLNNTATCTRNKLNLATANRPPYLTAQLDGVGSYTVDFQKQPVGNRGASPLLLVSTAELLSGAKYTARLALPTLTFALPSPNHRTIAAVSHPWHPDVANAVTASYLGDTHIRKNQPDDKFNVLAKNAQQKVLNVQNPLQIAAPPGDEYRILLSFHLAHFPGLGVNSHVVFSRLGLYQDFGVGSDLTIKAYRITQSWDANVTWNKSASGTNWGIRNGIGVWTDVPGGVHSTTEMGSMTAGGTEAGMRWMELTTSEVEKWWSEGNNGLLLKATGNGQVKFRSVKQEQYDSDVFEGPVTGQFRMRAPRLEVVYLSIAGCPPPANP